MTVEDFIEKAQHKIDDIEPRDKDSKDLFAYGFNEIKTLNGSTFYLSKTFFEEEFFIFDENKNPYIYLYCYEGFYFYMIENTFIIVGHDYTLNYNLETNEMIKVPIH